mmetsp:Transcript_7651/g.16078  ORF Transcript_7651/g.16078 Transcript_7651/m.16078 type:complete len:205 (-) Transcript_7651:28-642(-)
MMASTTVALAPVSRAARCRRCAPILHGDAPRSQLAELFSPTAAASRRGFAASLWRGAAAVGTAALVRSDPAVAAVKKGDPKKAAEDIRLARADMDKCDELAKKQKWSDMQALVDTGAVSRFESDILVVLGSDAISAQDKKDIGTIRRYGVGADVMIMLGGLKNELTVDQDDEDAAVNGAEVKKYIARSKASLDEIILILKANKV